MELEVLSGCDHVQPQQRQSPSSTFRRIESFELLDQIGRGSYGVVYRARDKATGETVAIKRELMVESSLKEVKHMRHCCHHSAVIKLKEVVFGNDDDPDDVDYVYLVMELAEEGALSSTVRDKSRDLDENRVRGLMYQLLQGLAHVHYKGVIHQDLKTQNLLLTSTGSLKIGDFGLSRRFFHGRAVPYVRSVGTRWYRAPELLMPSCKEYTAAIDVWSAGCIMGELVYRNPLFPGKREEDQLPMICDLLEDLDKLREMLPPESLSDHGFDLLNQMLVLDPRRRITAAKALRHPWFREKLVYSSSSASIDRRFSIQNKYACIPSFVFYFMSLVVVFFSCMEIKKCF